MIGLKRWSLLCVWMLFVFMLNGQNTYLNKKVILPGGQVMLKTALKSMSDQTGCVFSYDPTKIADKQPVTISIKGNSSLRSALTAVLPTNIQYKINGKYIVLQGLASKAVPADKTITNKLQKPSASAIRNSKVRGTIDKNLTLERLVLPPILNNEDTKPIAQTADSETKQPEDSVGIAQNIISVQPKDSDLMAPVIVSAIPEKQTLADAIPKKDTLKTEKSGFGRFMNKNGYLEMGVSVNKQLGAFSIHPGLYNVYAILSIGSDYHDSYLFGFGIGTKVRLDSHFSLNFDLLQNNLIAGKSYLLNVRASNTQLSPILNFTVLKSIKLFAGATLNLIKSSYEGDISSTDLGVLVGIGFSAGIKIDLKNIFSKHK